VVAEGRRKRGEEAAMEAEAGGRRSRRRNR
jgi:hypothetical protein